ncbi:hypothetical protein K461DRAFT_319642 [Myriangium duriaei CBS 260.36]|uniref:DUF676 domain-containing protein n=1 Tax=Myriangium duriaei CBS 260.36 TaxID=1168546 RepID=A0A9P4MMG8_9PEZI|nr:hypothetical protein K461DRAFT_319642 [Myriangium duriaei CBS 260.36]
MSFKKIWVLLAFFVLNLVYGALNFTVRHPSQGGSGFVRVDSSSSPVRDHGLDIVFVHGLGSNPETTWGPLNSTCWVRDFLPEDIPGYLRNDIRIYLYNYDSHFKRESVRARLRVFGENMLVHVQTELRRTPEEQARHLIFVGHSYGGLVIKQALVSARIDARYADILDRTKAIVFLGTPHLGASLQFSILGQALTYLLRPFGSSSTMVAEVSHERESLHDLHIDFENAVDDNVRVVNFYEMRKTGFSMGPFQVGCMVVEKKSATYARAVNIGLSLKHSDLNKFKTRDENYNCVLSHLRRLILSTFLQETFAPCIVLSRSNSRSF